MAERIRASHRDERARFTFTPHCTLNLYRELPEQAVKELLGVRFDDPSSSRRFRPIGRAGDGNAENI
jgi:hypothetical protein